MRNQGEVATESGTCDSGLRLFILQVVSLDRKGLFDEMRFPCFLRVGGRFESREFPCGGVVGWGVQVRFQVPGKFPSGVLRHIASFVGIGETTVDDINPALPIIRNIP